MRAVFSGCLVRVPEAWEGPFSGPLPFGGPEPGPSERSADPVLSPFAPKATGPAARAAPPGAAILQHHFYTASALAVDERARPGWTGRARGDSLRGLVHTSPEAAPRRRPGPRSGSHAGGYMYSRPALPGGVVRAQSKTPVVIPAQRAYRLSPLNRGSSPGNEHIIGPLVSVPMSRRSATLPH